MTETIFNFIKRQEVLYSQEIEVMENWNWCMKEHIRTSLLLKHGKFKTASNVLETKNPNKNIIYPILNLRYRAEDRDVRDVTLYANDSDKYHLSFLIKKYHDEVYIKEKKLDVLFDELKEEKIDLGGTLVRKGKEGPVNEPMESIAFCDQTDILAGPIGFKLFFSPDELYAMEKQGWGKKENGATITIEDLITLADTSKVQDTGIKTQTPGKNIEVYRIHGSLPLEYLRDVKDGDEKYLRQIHIVAFYKSQDGRDTGVTLYKKQEYENPFKLHLGGKKIRNRALAYGGVEELIDPQVWTNYSEIHKKNFLDAASKTGLWTTDEAYANRNKIKDMENLEVTVVKEGSSINQIPTASPNIRLFDQWVNEWDVHAQRTGGATDALLGENPQSGTPFRLENLITQQGQGLHDYRREKFDGFILEIYQDWIIPDIAKELAKGRKFLATLSEDEMEYVAECLVRNKSNKLVKEKILNGELIYQDEIDAFKETVKDEFMRGGNKRFIEILKGELQNVSLSVRVNVGSRPKDLAGAVDKLSRVFQQVFATFNPQTGTFAIFEDPRMSKIFSKIIEFSGLDPIDFNTYTKPKEIMPKMPIPQMMQSKEMATV